MNNNKNNSVARYNGRNSLTSPLLDTSNLLDVFFGSHLFGDPLSNLGLGRINPSNWKNTENSYVLEVELPRFKKEEVNVKAEDGYIKIVAESKDKTNYYENTFTIGSNVDASNISAKLEDGVLTITFPKTERAKGKVIDIS